MKYGQVRCCAVGDAFLIDRPAHTNEKIAELKNKISASDAAVTNVESNLHRFESDVYPARESGGDWAVASPDIVGELQWMGFNLLSAPNNHSLDFLHAGVVRTIEAFENNGAVYAGIGRNLADAEAPRYLATPNGRVALIALNLTFESWHPAGEQRRDCNGRPGINYVSHRKIHGVSEQTYQFMKRLTETYPRLGGEEDGLLRLENSWFEVGEENNIRTEACPLDVQRLCRSISRARRQADIVLVSVHSHENRNGESGRPAEFEELLARTCIDAGADAYIGHGPHVVRGIEIYKDRPIMYSLGNFFYQCELIERSPAEFYHKFKDFDETACTADVFDYREENGGILGETNPEYYRSVLVEFDLEKTGKLASLTVYPLDLNFSAHRALKGTPEFAEGELSNIVFNEIQERSAPYGTRFIRSGNTLVLKLDE